MRNNKNLIVIIGPTGTGKTDLSIEIAKMLDTVIISADSRQFYNELKIGTAAPTQNQLNEIKHFMIGNKSLLENYSAGKFEIETLNILENIFKNKNYAILTGGSGMYINAVCNGIDDIPDIDPEIRKNLCNRYDIEGIESLRFDLKKLDPEYYAKADLHNSKRILKALEICMQTGKTYSSFLKNSAKKRYFNIIKIGLERNRNELYSRIDSRVDQMIENGLIEEAKSLIKYKHLNSLNTVGYKELFDYFDGKYSLEEAVRLIKRNSRHYAKRQITWFKRDNEINWFNPDQTENIKNFINQKIKSE